MITELLLSLETNIIYLLENFVDTTITIIFCQEAALTVAVLKEV